MLIAAQGAEPARSWQVTDSVILSKENPPSFPSSLEEQIEGEAVEQEPTFCVVCVVTGSSEAVGEGSPRVSPEALCRREPLPSSGRYAHAWASGGLVPFGSNEGGGLSPA